jgi:hypothetical protein
MTSSRLTTVELGPGWREEDEARRKARRDDEDPLRKPSWRETAEDWVKPSSKPAWRLASLPAVMPSR